MDKADQVRACVEAQFSRPEALIGDVLASIQEKDFEKQIPSSLQIPFFEFRSAIMAMLMDNWYLRVEVPKIPHDPTFLDAQLFLNFLDRFTTVYYKSRYGHRYNRIHETFQQSCLPRIPEVLRRMRKEGVSFEGILLDKRDMINSTNVEEVLSNMKVIAMRAWVRDSFLHCGVLSVAGMGTGFLLNKALGISEEVPLSILWLSAGAGVAYATIDMLKRYKGMHTVLIKSLPLADVVVDFNRKMNFALDNILELDEQYVVDIFEMLRRYYEDILDLSEVDEIVSHLETFNNNIVELFKILELTEALEEGLRKGILQGEDF